MDETPDDDFLSVLEDDHLAPAPLTSPVWRVLIVDDDEDVHQTTRFAMANTPILGRALQFFQAYSAAQAERVLLEEPNIAVILLDVVMEREDAGLQLVRTIREKLGISEARIILRTGQPGYAPEIDAIRDYDINDYKTKSELSRNRLYTTLTAAIRCYDQIHAINASRRGLDMIIAASGKLTVRQGAREFAAGIITQISALLRLEPEGIVCAYDLCDDPPQTRVIAAAGRYTDCIDQPLSALAQPQIVQALATALRERRNLYGGTSTTLFFAGESGQDMAAYLQTVSDVDENDRRLLEVFCTNISVGLDNVLLFNRLKDHAYNDQLLHIPNRLAFIQAVDRRGPEGSTVALIDIDHFSQLNDALGHAYGDALLIAVKDRLQQQLPADCVLARVTGDTYGVLGDSGQVTPQALLGLFRQPFTVDGTQRMISASAGLVSLLETEGGGADALKKANIALRRAKEHHRGEHCHFTRDMEFETRSRVKLLQDLRVAFDRDRLFVVYQPQVNLRSGEVVGVEALLRWRTDDGRFVPPDKFIPLAENSGLIIALGAWVLRMACNAQTRLLREGARRLRMAVNVSVAQFRHPSFLDTVDEILSETGIEAESLELEITESVAMLDADFMVDMLHRFKQRRITIAIDDFGTGFSSLDMLRTLPLSVVKIDRSLIDPTPAPEACAVVQAICQLATALKLRVVAEGVETQEQAWAAQQAGCHEIQGYFYARPLAPEMASQWLRAGACPEASASLAATI